MKIDINYITSKSLINMKINQIVKLKIKWDLFISLFFKEKTTFIELLERREILIFYG